MSTMKKMIAISLTGVMLMGSASMVVSADSAEGKAYSDVKSTNWAYESIEAISQKGLIQGYPDGKFKPSGTLSYGEFIKMVLLADHSRKDKSSNDNWKDPGNAVDETGKLAVDPNTGNKKHWAQNYYDEALKRHYFLPTQIGVSQLAGQISRGDMALVISSALGEVKIERYDEIQSAIQDVTSKTKHEYDIIKAYATGVLTGYGDHTFRPEATLTRAESATVLWRLID
ncbi:MAG: S-layer homology domain-containing protein, partial [Anaerovorax sp.]